MSTNDDSTPNSGPQLARDLLIEIRNDVREIKTDMAAVKTTLFGKEKELGLVATVAILEARMKAVESNYAKIAWGVAGAVGLVVVGVLTGQIKIGPIP